MAILTHGSDLSLSPTLAPLVRQAGGTVRAALGHLDRAKFTGVQLDAALAGIRPRELSARARKDLVALFARQGLRPTGIDLFIPRKHYLDPARLDRAMTATLDAITFAADLGKLPLSLALPVAKLPGDLRHTLVEAADGVGIRLAVHAEDQLDALEKWIHEVDLPALGAAIDPAPLLARGEDPAAVLGRFGKRLTIARLSDVQLGGEAESVRGPVGEGELDVTAYRIAADIARGRTGPVVLDLRGLTAPLHAAVQARQAWEDAAFTL
ncbi:MAG: sugar phosphate isomerase/epimerase family protein [Phycisphaeraceae bacterium]